MKKLVLWSTIAVLFTFTLALYPARAQLQPNLPCPEGIACPGTGGIGSGTGITAVNNLIKTIINWLLSIAFGLAVLFLIIGGLRYIISAGNEESAEAAKNTIINALIGIVLIILSYVIINVVVNTITSSSSTTI